LCDWPENVPECQGGTRDPIETTTVYSTTDDHVTTVFTTTMETVPTHSTYPTDYTTEPTYPTTWFPELGPCASSPNEKVAHLGQFCFKKYSYSFSRKYSRNWSLLHSLNSNIRSMW